MVIVRLRKSRKEQWTYLTAREKRLKEAREYVCYTHITYHKLSINEAHTYPYLHQILVKATLYSLGITEVTVPDDSRYDSSVHLSFSDIMIDASSSRGSPGSVALYSRLSGR